jgi:hypothetical protein
MSRIDVSEYDYLYPWVPCDVRARDDRPRSLGHPRSTVRASSRPRGQRSRRTRTAASRGSPGDDSDSEPDGVNTLGRAA